jgi:HEAT repeat protein
MYSSGNPEVKLRAARGLVQRGDETPLELLVDILETLSRDGLGAETERALSKRKDRELVARMIPLLESKDHFVREVACNVLGHSGDRAATPHLLRMIDDTHSMVRRAAGFALAFLKDPQSLPELKRQYARHRQDNPNVVAALRCALQSLGEQPS